MHKKNILLSLILVFLLSGCKTTTNTSDNPIDDTLHCYSDEIIVDGKCERVVNEVTNEYLGTYTGLEDTTIAVGHYFNPLTDVTVLTDNLRDISYLLHIDGYVDYGTIGSYTLTYSLEFNGDSLVKTREITVVDTNFVPSTTTRPVAVVGPIYIGEGSYSSGPNTSINHPINPAFIESDLLDVAIPSSSWWTSLLVANYGGSNGIYTNPLRISYTNDGMEITNPEDGFVQYWNNNGVQTIAQYPIALKDTFLKTTDLALGYTTKVIDYSDSSVKVALRNNGSSIDSMVTTLVQGSPYVFVETANNELLYNFDVNAVDNYEYYTLDGTLITSSSYTSDSIIVKLVHRHSGYDGTPPATVGAAEYSDKYYLVNASMNTTFTIDSNNHPFGLNNQLQITLGDGKYLSIVAINDLNEAEFYHQHGYSFITNTNIDYDIDYENSIVNTTYTYASHNYRTDLAQEPLLALMPHHYNNSSVSLTDYSFRTVRGTLKVFAGNSFDTLLNFNGLVPGYTLPSNDEFSTSDTISYLNNLNSSIDLNDSEGYINKEGPYWNSKAIYPLAQGIIIADQLDETALKDNFIAKLRYVLEDWFTYSSSSDEKYLYYNNTWGSVYYSNDDFGTASALSDHSFTHGYLVYGASVLAMYDDTFVNQYGDMVDLLLDDYMYPIKDDPSFAYLRNFDPWAGHSWAHGYGTFAEGNNLESSSEALNSWVGGYLWALATNDQERMDAAIYGFATELSAAKEYWFDYNKTNWDPGYGDYVDVVGMIWGGKQDYATWFGANPTFIYGIQWIPTGEYLTNYALNDTEYVRLTEIFDTYLEAKNGTIDTWYSNMWAIEAIINPSQALTDFDSTFILNDDYPNELVGSYWMVNALKSLNHRTQDVWMEIQLGVSSSIYQLDNGAIVAMVWNVSDTEQVLRFYDETGVIKTVAVGPESFTNITIK